MTRKSTVVPAAEFYKLYTCGLAERNRKETWCQHFEAQAKKAAEMTNAANDVAAFARPALRLPTRLAVGFGLEALEACGLIHPGRWQAVADSVPPLLGAED
jgi:hypothetical protein